MGPLPGPCANGAELRVFYVPPTPSCWALGKVPGARPGCVWSGAAPLHPWASLASPVLSGHIQKRSKFCPPLPHPKATLFPTHFPAWLTAGASLSLRTNGQFYPPQWGVILRAPQIITERSTFPRGGLLVLPMSTSSHTYNRPCWKRRSPPPFSKRQTSLGGVFLRVLLPQHSDVPFVHAFIH